MPLQFNPQNVIGLAASISPIFITFYFILEGAFSGHIKFIIWLIGLFIAILLGMLLRGSGSASSPDDLSNAEHASNFVDKCITFDGPFSVSNILNNGHSSHAIFHSFTITYILQSIIANPNSVGWSFLITLVIIATIDLLLRHKNRCNTPTNVLKGIGLGAFIGVMWQYIILQSSWPGPEYLYFGKENTMKKCKLGKTRFRCKQGDQTFII